MAKALAVARPTIPAPIIIAEPLCPLKGEFFDLSSVIDLICH
jgi:hypothetical protein